MTFESKSAGRARGMASTLVAAMRYALLRPRMKQLAIALLSLHPRLLMSVKRFAVRAGLASDMGHLSNSLRSRNTTLAHQGLSPRAARIYDELQHALSSRRK